MSLYVDSSGAGPDLVLIHGWGMNAAVWEGLPVALMGKHRINRVELPGHGASPFEPAGNELLDWAGACLEGTPRRAVWVGWSLGGLIAQEAALGAPQRVAGLVLIAATPRFVTAADWPHGTPAGTFSGFRDALLVDPAGTLDRFLALQVRGGEAARDTLRTLRRELAQRPNPTPAALARGLALLRESDLRDRLGALACPTLWLFGERDTLVPAAVSESLAGLLPSARQAMIPGAGHAPLLSHPRETWDEIASFLSEIGW